MRARTASLLVLALMLAYSLSAGTSLAQGGSHLGPTLATQRPLLLHFAGFDDPSFSGFYSFQALQYPHPNVKPIVITVVKGAVFNDTGPVPYNATVYVPPGDYSMVLLNVTINEKGGSQYDRTIYVYANNITVFWGSTQQIMNSTAEVDLTLLENFLKGNVTFKIVLPNYYSKKYNLTGVYNVTVELLLYPGKPPANLPNYVIPLFYNPSLTYPLRVLTPESPNVTEAVKFPRGTYNAMLVLYLKGGGYDEFWYASLPAVRDFLVYYNGNLAGVVQPYPVIYTGGINPFYWKPVPSINALSFHMPQYIPLTPLLASGLKGNLTVEAPNLVISSKVLGSASMKWDVSGYILVWNSSDPLVNATFVKSYAYYLDSGPILGVLGYGYGYSEGAKFHIEYETELYYKSGTIVARYTASGSTKANQVFNAEHIKAVLNEDNSISYASKGLFNFSYISSINNAVALDFSAFAARISSSAVPPINYSYIQNGSLKLTTQYVSQIKAKGLLQEVRIEEGVEAVGGFDGVVTVINDYGGAILDRLTSNYAVTAKSLKAHLNLYGFTADESIKLVGYQNSTTNLTGFYKDRQVSVSYGNYSVSSQSSSPLMALWRLLFLLIQLFIT
ncbi:MAG: peptide-N4-asparagine amidase [Thermoprotei archaeon]